METQITITAALWNALVACADKPGSVRPKLNSVHATSDGYLEASDGSIAIRAKVADALPDVLLTAVKAPKASGDIVLSFAAGGPGLLQGSASISLSVDGFSGSDFPEIERVTDLAFEGDSKREGAGTPAAFNANYLALVLGHWSRILKAGKCHGAVRLETNGPRNVARLSSIAMPEVNMYLMPMRD